MDTTTKAQTILAGRAWTPELVLRVASELVHTVKGDSLSLKDKSVLATQTIQEMLADAEKADTVLKEGSTGTEKTTPSNLEDCKRALDLLHTVVDLAHKPSVPHWKWTSCFSSSSAAPAAAASLAAAAPAAASLAAAAPAAASLAPAAASLAPAAAPAAAAVAAAAVAAAPACFSFLRNFFQKKPVADSVTAVHVVDQSPAEKKSEEVLASQEESVQSP